MTKTFPRGGIERLKKDRNALALSDREIRDGCTYLDPISRNCINGMAIIPSKKSASDPTSRLTYRKTFINGKEVKERRENFPAWDENDTDNKLNLLLQVRARQQGIYPVFSRLKRFSHRRRLSPYPPAPPPTPPHTSSQTKR